MKPIIGIVGRADVASEDYSVICCYESVRRSVIKCGGIPILILPNQDVEYEKSIPKDMDRLTDNEKEDLKRVLNMCDGIIMPGTYKLYEYDKFIYESALELDMPILGICGGMQLMGLNDDGTLIKNNVDNHFKRDEKYVHKVSVVEDTLLKKIVSKDELNVNSRHNYHLSKVSNLKVSAYSEDGLIEAVEYPNKKFVLGIQWHPENMLDYDEYNKKIIEAFISSTRI